MKELVIILFIVFYVCLLLVWSALFLIYAQALKLAFDIFFILHNSYT